MECVKCRVKIIVNRDAQISFNIRGSPESGLVNIKLIIKNVSEIHSLLDFIEKTINPHYNWNIEWNWKNVPESLKKDAQLRKKMLEMFSSALILPMPNFGRKEFVENTEYNNLPTEQFQNINQLNGLISDIDSLSPKTTIVQRRPTRITSATPKVAFNPAPVYIPPPIRENKECENIQGEYDELDALASKVVMHIHLHRAAPDLFGLEINPKKKLKAINFIRTILARPDLNEEKVLTIAKRAAPKIVQQF
jgi:hypothetical protein